MSILALIRKFKMKKLPQDWIPVKRGALDLFLRSFHHEKQTWRNCEVYLFHTTKEEFAVVFENGSCFIAPAYVETRDILRK